MYNYALTNTPVVITGVVDKMMSTPWTMQHIKDKAGKFEFIYNYALTNTPVVITGVVDKMMTSPWTMQHIRDKAGKL